MVIKPSPAREIAQLVTALGSDDNVRRESAIARLTVIGARAADRLVAAYDSAPQRNTRVAVLRVLESIGDQRIIALARRALDDGGELAVAATAALRGLLDSTDRATATGALDALVSVVLEGGRGRQVRLAAYDALQHMPERIRAPLKAVLEADADPALTALLSAGATDGVDRGAWHDALEGRLPESPASLRRVVQDGAKTASVAAVQALIDRVRERESSIRSVPDRAEWQALRGALHLALSFRGSRIALYDLNESLADAKGPLPPSFVSALHGVGDASCLEAIAAAHARAAGDAVWRQQLAAAFRAIVKRERVTRRHAAMKRIAARWPGTAREITGAD
jgi:HEAT repeat protein